MNRKRFRKSYTKNKRKRGWIEKGLEKAIQKISGKEDESKN